ncbi:hypothetical protein BZA77DRAFT_312333 [Pyronema omphalodes]|nr:hypothetical protein BZA77DRAFT_312333 [Pyronema omphalodes]
MSTASGAHFPTEPDRSMEIVTEADFLELFAGAPHLKMVPRADRELLSEDEYGLETSVTFPFGGAIDDTDYKQLGHPAFILSTSCNEEEEDIVKEVPSMNSFMGIEPGTCGWDYFLMLPVGDSDRDQDSYEDELDEGGRERSSGLRETRGGVRTVEVGYIVDRLKELGRIWQAKKRGRKDQTTPTATPTATPVPSIAGDDDEDEEEKDVPSSVEMYSHLFTYVLFPPTRITTEDFLDPYSLKVQIMALIQTLSKKIWLDFSKVQWRIKLGQILWADNLATEINEDEDDPDYEEWKASAKESERVWLLLQILLACELVVRMDTVISEMENPELRRGSVQSNHSIPETKEQLLYRFREAGGTKVQWDILLARRWLENIRIVEMAAKTQQVEKVPERSSFLVPPSRWFTFKEQPTPPEPEAPPTPDAQHVTDALLLPRNPRRQIRGLLHFAKKIQWPNIDSLAQQTMGRSSTPASSIYSTPMANSPMSVHSTSSYFSGVFPKSKRLRELASDVPTLRRQKSSMLTVPSVAGRGGWLSRSFLTGLILPGEGMGHLIMSTLLENDPAAVEVLGYNANLYCGFQYHGRTWWSRYCIVGRVMAGCAGVGEECGWVGPVMESGVTVESGRSVIRVGEIPDGWVDVVTFPPSDAKTPRAMEPKKISENCDARGKDYNPEKEMRRFQFLKVNGQASSADSDVEAHIRGLYFNEVEHMEDASIASTMNMTVDGFQSYEVSVHILVGPRMGQKKLHILDLKYDVSFVSAWPCGRPNGDGHLLHESFEHVTLRIEELSQFHFEESRDRVIVVNVWNPGQRVFAYAWCAQRGQSAVVAASGRSCVGCAIREASALRLGVVIVVRF